MQLALTGRRIAGSLPTLPTLQLGLNVNKLRLQPLILCRHIDQAHLCKEAQPSLLGASFCSQHSFFHEILASRCDVLQEKGPFSLMCRENRQAGSSFEQELQLQLLHLVKCHGLLWTCPKREHTVHQSCHRVDTKQKHCQKRRLQVNTNTRHTMSCRQSIHATPQCARWKQAHRAMRQYSSAPRACTMQRHTSPASGNSDAFHCNNSTERRQPLQCRTASSRRRAGAGRRRCSRPSHTAPPAAPTLSRRTALSITRRPWPGPRARSAARGAGGGGQPGPTDRRDSGGTGGAGMEGVESRGRWAVGPLPRVPGAPGFRAGDVLPVLALAGYSHRHVELDLAALARKTF